MFAELNETLRSMETLPKNFTVLWSRHSNCASPLGRSLLYPSLDCRFLLAWGRGKCWLPALEANMEQLPCASQEPTNKSLCGYLLRFPACLFGDWLWQWWAFN